MKLTEFRIQNYRSIIDSGWVTVDDITVVVGKNESGKTSLLKALWKFNPFHEAKYNLDREWPRGRRKEKSSDKVVATVRFKFEPNEIAEIGVIHDSAIGVTGVEIERDYSGGYAYTFLPKNPENGESIEWVVSLLRRKLHLPEGFSEHFRAQFGAGFEALLKQVREHGGTPHATSILPKFKGQFSSFVAPNNPQHQNDHNLLGALNVLVDEAMEDLKATPLRRAIDAIHEKLPTFVYMDDYKVFRGTCQLDQVKQRKDSNKLTADDETLIQIMEMAGLDLDQEVKKATGADKEQRMLDLNDASLSLTEEIASRWSQKKYEVRFEADGQHFITFVKDVGVPALVPLEERSKGFQWFFSFDMMLMYETQGKFENAIILLDEPGLHLHAAAQTDLLKRIGEYAKKNQLIYSTHLPFMIQFTRLDNIYVAEEVASEGTKVHKNWATADKDARFTLQAALGLSWSQSLFVGQYNLVVEGVTDFWFLSTISTILRDAGEQGLDEDLVITPVGGGSKAAYVGTILRGQNLNVAVLLDSDLEGKNAYDQLVKQWIMDAKHVLTLGHVLGLQEDRTLEDLFDDAYYATQVNSAYHKELGNKRVTLVPGDKRPIVERVEAALKNHGISSFNKGRVAKRIMEELPKKKLVELPKETVQNFQKVIHAVNECVAAWKKSHPRK